MKITDETYPYGPELLGYDSSIATQVCHLLHELRDEYNVKFSFDYEYNGSNGILSVDGALLAAGDARTIEKAVSKWMWERYKEYAAANIEKLKSVFPSEASSMGYYLLSYPSYQDYSRPFPNVTIYWEPTGKMPGLLGGNYMQNAIFRFFELNQPWEVLDALVNERVDMSHHYSHL